MAVSEESVEREVEATEMQRVQVNVGGRASGGRSKALHAWNASIYDIDFMSCRAEASRT